MSNSMFIPLLRMPETVQELRDIIDGAFADFGRPKPTSGCLDPLEARENLLKNIIKIEGTLPGEQCWISMSESTEEITEDRNCMYIASVTTRTDWWFSGIVAYAICKALGMLY